MGDHLPELEHDHDHGTNISSDRHAAIPLFVDPRGALPGNSYGLPVHRQYHIELLDHDHTIEKQIDDPAIRLWGEDYIAGGGGEDEIFGQLGADVIQGDGAIGTDSRSDLDKLRFAGDRFQQAASPTESPRAGAM